MMPQREKENYYKAGFLITDVGTKAEHDLIYYHLNGQPLAIFIDRNQHEIFHLYSNKPCCQCGNTVHKSNKCVLKSYQMEKIFQPKIKRQNHRHKKDEDKFCCSAAKPWLQLKDFDMSLLYCILINCCGAVFWDSCLHKKSKTIETFLNDNIHHLYHLWRPKKCCLGSCPSVNGKQPVIHDNMWQSLFINNGQPKCINMPQDTCSFNCKTNLCIGSIDKTLEMIILRNCCSLRISVDKLHDHRNKMCHKTAGELNDIEFRNIWNACKNDILEIAAFLNKEDFYKSEISLVDIRQYDESAYERIKTLLEVSKYGHAELTKGIEELKTDNIEIKQALQKLLIHVTLQEHSRKVEEIVKLQSANVLEDDNAEVWNNTHPVKEEDNCKNKHVEINNASNTLDSNITDQTSNYDVQLTNGQNTKSNTFADAADDNITGCNKTPSNRAEELSTQVDKTKVLLNTDRDDSKNQMEQLPKTDIDVLRNEMEQLRNEFNQMTLILGVKPGSEITHKQTIYSFKGKGQQKADNRDGKTKHNSKISQFKSGFSNFIAKVRKNSCIGPSIEEENDLDMPNDRLSFHCGGCGIIIEGSDTEIRNHRRSCLHRIKLRETNETNVVFEEENLPNTCELAAYTQGAVSIGCFDTDVVQVHDIARGSLYIWTKMSQKCFRTKEIFIETVRSFFQNILRDHSPDSVTDISITVHIMEQLPESDSDDLDGDLYTCNSCHKEFPKFKLYLDHKKEMCNRVRIKHRPQSARLGHLTMLNKPVSVMLRNKNYGKAKANISEDRLAQESELSDVGTECDEDISDLTSAKLDSSTTSGYESDIEYRVKCKQSFVSRLGKSVPERSNISMRIKEVSEASGYETMTDVDITSEALHAANNSSDTGKKSISSKFRKQRYRPTYNIELDSDDEDIETPDSRSHLNYYQQSCQLQATFNDNNYFRKFAIHNGLQLSKPCVTRLTCEMEESKKKKYTDFYAPFLERGELLKLLSKEPKKYKSGTLFIESSHGAICIVRNPLDKVQKVLISGRSKCGKAYNEDEVVVKLLHDTMTDLPAKVYGEVIGVLERSKKKDIDHPVFLCELDSFDNDQVKPICKTIPKLQLLQSKRNKNYFTVDLYKYNAEKEDLAMERSIKITPSRRRRYLFYVVYISWTTIYPTAVAIGFHSPTKELLSGLTILELQFEVPTIYKPSTVSRTQNKLDARFQDLKSNREDFTKRLKVFTIDPKLTDVFDDAISVERLDGGRFRVGVHISDVTAYIEKDDDIDIEARERGTTFFVGQYCDPHYMLPEPLSTDTCSLRPGCSRLTITVFLYFSKDFKFEGYRFLKSCVQSSAQLTYEYVQKVIDGYTTSEKFQDEITLLFEISTAIRKHRLEMATFGIPLEYGLSDDIETETNCFQAYYVIEELMILANESVAKYLMQKKGFNECVPLRCQDAPSTKRVQDWLQSYPQIIDQIVQLQGVKPQIWTTIKLKNIDLKALRYADICFIQKWVWTEIASHMQDARYNEALKMVCKDELHPFQALALDEWFSIQENAVYRCSGCLTEKREGSHFGLNKFPYLHFTAPIRRYIDIIVHRLLHAALNNDPVPYKREEMREICSHINMVSMKSNQYEKKCQSLLLAHEVLKQPKVIYGFVKKFTDQDICFLLPGFGYITEENRSLMLNDLDVCCQPEFKTDTEKINTAANREILILNWDRRIYSKLECRPKPKNWRIGYQWAAKDEAQRIDPHQRIGIHHLKKWLQYVNSACTNDLSKCAKLFQQGDDNSSLFRYVATTFNTEYDVNSEIERKQTDTLLLNIDREEATSGKLEERVEETNTLKDNTNDVKTISAIITKQSTKFTMSFSHGQVVAVQLSSDIYKGILTPYIQIVDMTENVKFCTEHMRDPVHCLAKYSVEKPKLKYDSIEQYKDVWIPIVMMESVMGAVRSDTITINEVDITFRDDGGYFVLRSQYCDERNIVLGPMKI